MINIRLKPEEFPFKVIKRLLIRFVTPEVSQDMLIAKMHLAPLLCGFQTSLKRQTADTPNGDVHLCYTPQSQLRAVNRVCQLVTNFSHQGSLLHTAQ